MEYNVILANEFKLTHEHSKNIIALIDDGNSIPFIARYRKEMTGSCDDQVLREFADRLVYLRKLDERKSAVSESITSQGLMTDVIASSLNAALTLTEVEDIYRPFKPKRKTRATVAVTKGLQELADIIFEQNPAVKDIDKIAEKFINEEKGVSNIREAIDGAKDIIAEQISSSADLRKALRGQLYSEGRISTALIKDDEKVKDKIATYEMYDNFSEPINKIAAHRILAINRAVKEECLKSSIVIPEEMPLERINAMFVKDAPTSALVKVSGADAYSRLIKTSIETEVWNELFEKASEQAIKVFELNLKPLLLQPPIKNKVTLGVDPAYRTGCKLAVTDANGNVLDRSIAYFTPPHNKIEESKLIIKNLIKKHKVEIIAIGNGTASKESEIFIADLIKEIPESNLQYMVVNEAGASVYSASKLGAEEFPDFDVAHRSAASIARRLQDPLAELIKIDPKSIGVGQYQHDMPENRLDAVLSGVVEDCVNSVGVDLNSASYSLLSYIAGLNTTTAKNIVAYRAASGGFKNRTELLKVPKLGPKAYEQCAGFMRIPGAKNVLDNTAVHPESYGAAQKLLELFKLDLSMAEENNLSKLDSIVNNYGREKAAAACGVGVPTLDDIIKELIKPGRDIRDELPPPMLRSDIMDINDLKEGMELTGTVRNVIDFGVFVDIGVHQDGLVHISEITDTYIRHPSEVLSIGEIVKVKVISVDKEKNRISLTMKQESGQAAKRAKQIQDERRMDKESDKNFAKYNKNKNNFAANPKEALPKKELSFDEALKNLANKFNKR